MSNSFLMKAAMSFSMLYFSSAFEKRRMAGPQRRTARQLAASLRAAWAGVVPGVRRAAREGRKRADDALRRPAGARVLQL